jgi:diadenosine tetraphosphate (Ap4A) HIT family hydrolase
MSKCLCCERYEWCEWVAKITSALKYRYYLTLSPTLLLTLHIPPKSKQESYKLKTYDSEGQCKFCKLAESGAQLLYQDELVGAFFDLKKVCRVHIQVVPRRHIHNIYELEETDIPLIRRMHEVGRMLLANHAGYGEFRFGFHIPPHNSIQHLHLHCIALPFQHIGIRKSYSNWLYFMSPEDLIHKLSST